MKRLVFSQATVASSFLVWAFSGFRFSRSACFVLSAWLGVLVSSAALVRDVSGMHMSRDMRESDGGKVEGLRNSFRFFFSRLFHARFYSATFRSGHGFARSTMPSRSRRLGTHWSVGRMVRSLADLFTLWRLEDFLIDSSIMVSRRGGDRGSSGTKFSSGQFSTAVVSQ
jgi:hypothetical protein